nr:hypothetical protein [Tanacetum cinerariifolium]
MLYALKPRISKLTQTNALKSSQRTVDITIDQQVALDEALIPHASRLRIGKSNFRLRPDITSKESTLQLVYDVLRLTPFYKAFLVIADVPEIYMQKFWATATVHHQLIRFKMDNKKRIVNLEYFREMLHICSRLPGQTFDELPFEVEILAFLRFLRHSGEEHLQKVIIHYFMSKDPLIPRRNKVNWHYFRDDQMFTTIKLVSRHQNTQQFGVMLPIELTNEDIRNSEAYKEYYAVTSGAAPPKTKASFRKTKSSFDTTITPPTAAGTRLSTSAKAKQPAKTSKAKSLTVFSEIAMTEAEQIKLATKRSLQQTHISQASGSGADEGTGIIPGVPDVPTKERVLGAVVGGVGACGTLEMVGMVRGVRVGAVNVREATIVEAGTSIWEVVSKRESIPALGLRQSMLVTN